jgi:hypothetical protein
VGKVFDAAAWDGCQQVGSLLDWLTLSLKGVKTSVLKTGDGRRRMRLFLCAVVRRVWHLLEREESRKAVETAERFADGEADERQLQDSWAAAKAVVGSFPALEARALVLADDLSSHRLAALGATCAAAERLQSVLGAWAYIARVEFGVGPRAPFASGPYCDVLRDLFGNPFRPVVVPAGKKRSWLAWNGGTVVGLARQVYAERAFDRLPLLADALEDAGCDNADVLGHLREPGPHVRGCWALDLLLGK